MQYSRLFPAVNCSNPSPPPPRFELTISLPGNGSRSYAPSDIETYKVSVLSETTGDFVVPTTVVNPGTFTAELPVGSYSVIVQGFNPQASMCELGYPLVIGRKNGVTVTDGGTTEAEVTMIDFGYGVYFDNPPQNSTAIQNPDSFDWGTVLLPQTIAKDGYTFDGWYTDNTFSQKMTELPDTTDWKNLKRPAAKFTQGGGQGQQGGNNQGNNNTLVPQGGTGLYFARATGEGDGTSPSDAKAFSDLISALNSDGLEPPTGSYITIYLLDGISSDSTIEIGNNVKIIGAKNGYLNQKSTITRTDNNSAPVFTISEGKTCFLDDLIIDGSTDGIAAHQGISNNGTLTLNKCNIKNCTATNGAGIYCDTGSLTLKDDSTVSGCNADNNGGGIYFSSSGTLTITDSTIGGDNESDKCTAIFGGGISTTGTGSLVISGTSKIKNCTANSYGGGLSLTNTYESYQTITLNGTTISYCEANYGNSNGDGGGIYVNCTNWNNLYPITISHCTIDHCTVRELGGAISITSGTMSVSNTTISNCSTGYRGGGRYHVKAHARWILVLLLLDVLPVQVALFMPLVAVVTLHLNPIAR